MEAKNSFNKPLIVFRINTPKALEFAIKIARYIIESKYIEYLYVEDLSLLNSNKVFGNDNYSSYFKSFDLESEDSNLCILVGGDGTALWGNNLFKNKERPPFLNFHYGYLGFLMIYDPKDYEKILDELYSPNGVYHFQNRSLIEHRILNEKDNTEVKKFYTLNDVVIDRSANKKIVVFKVYLKNKLLTRIACDGLIFSTPTGSTAYNLSAGGPIIHTDLECVILNALNPFSLSFRPIVFGKENKISVKVDSERSELPSLAHDGIDDGILGEGQYAEVGIGEMNIKFILIDKFTENLEQHWISKISGNLRWNTPFEKMSE